MGDNMEYRSVKMKIENGIDRETRMLLSDFTILYAIYDKKIYKPAKDSAKCLKTYRRYEKNNDDEEFNKRIYEKIYEENLKNNFEKSERLIELYEDLITHLNDILNTENKNKISVYEYLDNLFSKQYDYQKIFEENFKKIKGNINTIEEKNKCKIINLLLVVYRIRNNTFHGSKSVKKIKTQYELINICCEVLSCLIGDLLDSSMQE